ncbi:hypothetical protein E1263_00655 [Kribbella antibiotica]|uniref:Integrase catalytic domain-containing protein n=1 Tax=Kribbella antibiotica TaxID=190195 RepID=A0A4R4ZWB4_9ACTN|nr:hypothetical protein E1263_00655 [Kribbella antibiotica]
MHERQAVRGAGTGADPLERPAAAEANAGQRGRRVLLRDRETELIQRHTQPTYKGVTSAIFNYIEGWYNRRRRHSTLGYLSPTSYESFHATTHQQVA